MYTAFNLSKNVQGSCYSSSLRSQSIAVASDSESEELAGDWLVNLEDFLLGCPAPGEASSSLSQQQTSCTDQREISRIHLPGGLEARSCAEGTDSWQL